MLRTSVLQSVEKLTKYSRQVRPIQLINHDEEFLFRSRFREFNELQKDALADFVCQIAALIDDRPYPFHKILIRVGGMELNNLQPLLLVLTEQTREALCNE